MVSFKRKGIQMKRLTALALCFAMLLPCLLFSSCGGETADATTDDGTYTVTFSVNGEETSVEVAAGETPEYTGELEWETDEHYYKITGWDKEFVPADADTTYTATVGEYGLTVYDVRFNLPSGIVKVPTHEGETPTPPKGYETDLSRVDKIGAFDHWMPALEAPTAENMEGKKFVMYTPVYNYSTRYYTVTFAVGENEYKVEVAGNKIPACPVDPDDAVKDDITLRFTGWDKEVVGATEDATYTAVYGSSASILPAKDGAKGILTLTYDDGIYSTGVWVDQMNKKYDLKGSFMLVPNWGDSHPNFTYAAGSVSKWKNLFAEGTLEPESHSMTHTMLPSNSFWDDETRLSCYQENYQYELVQARDTIESTFGTPCLCYAPANNTLSNKSLRSDGNGNLLKDATGSYIEVSDGGAEKVAAKTYYAIRRGNRTFVQTLDPPTGTDVGCWHNLAIKAFKDSDSKETSVRCGWIDSAVQNGTWLIIMCHGIKGSGASDAGDLTTTEAEEFFSYASRYVQSGELWCATFGEATKYIREKQNTTVSERYSNGTVYVDVKINRTAADGKNLPENVFNYPLTVEVRVPTGWQSVGYGDRGVHATASVYTGEDGFSYAMLNLTPDADGVTVTVAVSEEN